MTANEIQPSTVPSPPAGARRRMWGWYLFDFANSILIINGGLYFPQWIVVDNQISDLWFNVAIVLGSLVLLLTAAPLGVLSDRRWGSLPLLRYTSLAMFLGGLTIAAAGLLIPDRFARVTLSLFAFAVIMYAYQLSIVFYNVLLGRVSVRSDYGRVSGVGLAWGWIGGILGILFIMPFVAGQVPFFQPAGRIQAILPSTILYGVLVLTSLFLIRDADASLPSDGSSTDFKQAFRGLIQNIRDLPHQKALWCFLLAYFLYSDAVLTIQNNSTIYMERVLRLSDDMKAVEFIIVLVTGAIGAIASGRLTRGSGLRRSLQTTIWCWAIAVLVSGLIRDATWFTVLFAILGLLNGALWNLSRVLFLQLIPVERRGEYFGIYSSYERSATMIGPLIWSAVVISLPTLGTARYQLAWLTMAPILVVSAVLLSSVRLETGNGKAA